MRVLGIDPGLERIGVALVEKRGSSLRPVEYRLIQTPRIALIDRLNLIHQEVTEAIRTGNPDIVVTEKLIFAANKTTAMDVSKALGVILLAVSQSGIPWCEVTPPEIKQAVVGYGNADKKQVQFMVTKLLSLLEPPKPDDVSDALAIAICQCMRAPIQSLTKG